MAAKNKAKKTSSSPQSNSNTARGKSQRKNKNETSTTNSRTRSIYVSMTVFMGCIACIFAILISAEYNLIFKKTYKTSEILAMEQEEILSFLKVLDGQLERVNLDLRKERQEAFTTLIKPKLNQIQGRYSSLKTQTLQYEQIPTKIPGGPKSFIQTSIQEIDSLMTELLVLDQKALAALHLKHPWETVEEELHPLSLIVFSKPRSYASEPEQQRVMVDNGIELWPESWATQDPAAAQHNYDEALKSNVTLEEAFTSLRQATEALRSLVPLFKKYEELESEVRWKHFLDTSLFPGPIAEYLYRFGVGSNPHFSELMKEISKTRMDMVMRQMALLQNMKDGLVEDGDDQDAEDVRALQNDFRFLDDYVTQHKAIMGLFAQHEAVLRSVMPMKYIYLDRAKTFVEKVVSLEKSDREGPGNNVVVYTRLKNEIFAQLGELRERVVNLGN